MRRSSLWFAGAAWVAVYAGLLAASPVQANGRMPGASQLKVQESDASRLVVQATFGLLQSFDRGATWSWICEEAISTAGVVADPPLATARDGSLVVLPPLGGTLVSHDQGCSWEHPASPDLEGRTVDLTTDPADPSRVIVLISTVDGLDDKGFAMFSSRLVESRDSAHTWSLLAELPRDVQLETIEVAGSDPKRLYVSGTSNVQPSLGVLLRSEDGGVHWERATLELPQGRGSLLISAVDPKNADRLWARVPARGDINGALPASLYVSADKGQHWQQIAATQRGMFGFALSPDGTELAYGGPSDGLFVGPSDGSGFEKVSDLTVMCLHWSSDAALYACASEPPNTFSVGRSIDRGRSFEPLYTLADTCPHSCADGTSSSMACASAWPRVAPLVRASGAMCSLPDTGTAAFAGKSGAGPQSVDGVGAAADGGSMPSPSDASAVAATRAKSETPPPPTAAPAHTAPSGCSVSGPVREHRSSTIGAAWLWLAVGLALRFKGSIGRR